MAAGSELGYRKCRRTRGGDDRPRAVVPSKNVILPLGVPVPGDTTATDAESVIMPTATAGGWSVVVVPAACTFKYTRADELFAKSGVPL